MFTSKEIRQQFIDFFIKKGHIFVKSSSVVPKDDPTLLFTNAGMNQFKDIFLGKKEAEYPRAVNSQKCIRAGGKHNDLNEVGKDGYHHTFFEMLGNWSFGDYYKKEAISYAWELLTEVWKLPKDKLHATVHHTDDEAWELWKSETDIEHTHITKHGDKDNFWEMGETGPCGPCSEIHLDRGIDFCNLKDHDNHTCLVNGDCHRYIELWNLVFMQFLRHEDKSLTPLKKKYVDTGAGFERLCQILQGVKSNYETDLFMPIINQIEIISNVPYQEDTGMAHRVIADHVRTLCFAMSDGGLPANEGRGYVLRRILRRATRYGRKLNINDTFIHKLVDVVNNLMGECYDELNSQSILIKKIIKAEEEKFNQTLDKGLVLFDELITKLGDEKIISGKDAFTLYDTYGFPLDLTMILAEEKKLTVNQNEFVEEMEKQKKRARESSNFRAQNENLQWNKFREDVPTEFFGYTNDKYEVHILRYAVINDREIRIVLDKTSLYAEAGGQVADMGYIFNDTTLISVDDVQKVGDVFIHYGKICHGHIYDVPYFTRFRVKKRIRVEKNHTATHLLHAVLREKLGDHVQQKGSYVDTEGLRFDFSHFSALSEYELDYIEKKVNYLVKSCAKVNTSIEDFDKAKQDGAIALFDEKYDNEVRVVTIGQYSKELCGGTHVFNTGQIGLFKIISETSIASGIRRIEAITGRTAEKYVSNLEKSFFKIYELLSANKYNVYAKINKLILENKSLLKENERLRIMSFDFNLDSLLKNMVSINSVNCLFTKVNSHDSDELKTMGDLLRNKIKSGIGVLVAEFEDKISILVIVSKDLTNNISAGKIVGELATVVDGRGGGRADMAMAGGKAIEKIDDLMKAIPSILEKFLF
ncbi:MAG: alanine--tRNA ligase [Candidatus Cloacimonetes bacterium]|nr:alanine--tRNA ligase [Candidatus Cloacimonadota bacterium]